jgi:hypothetical protein
LSVKLEILNITLLLLTLVWVNPLDCQICRKA